MNNILIFFISIASLSGCTFDDENSLSHVKIRLSNVSQFDFLNIIVNTGSGNVHFKNLRSGLNSEYKLFDKAYSYAFIELEIEGETFTIQPVDYLGESLLRKGYYTYQLDVNDTGDRYTKLNLKCIKD